MEIGAFSLAFVLTRAIMPSLLCPASLVSWFKSQNSMRRVWRGRWDSDEDNENTCETLKAHDFSYLKYRFPSPLRIQQEDELKLIELLLLCLLTFGCGSREESYLSQWIGIWQHAVYEKDELVLRNSATAFKADGTWEVIAVNDSDSGTYAVFDDQFVINEPGSKPFNGRWTRTGDTLTLVSESGRIYTYLKVRSFSPIPPPPRTNTPKPEDGEEDGDVAPSATTANTAPAAGSEVAPNASLTITLDEAVTAVTVNGTAATGSGKTWTINLGVLNLPAGSATLNIGWTNKDGSAGAGASVALTIQAEADTTAPAIDSSTVSNNDKDVDPAGLNTDGISITFSEDVTAGDISISIEGGDALNWLADWSANSVTIVPAKGAELGNETSYEISVSTEDGSANKLDATISFVTRGKE